MKPGNVVLIGFMGSGKTTIGIKLSYKLRMTVEDTDKLIEGREGCLVGDIFREKGELYFRERETELLRELAASSSSSFRSAGSSSRSAKIYSVGGGTPLRPENSALLKKMGTVVYLRVRPETVYERLKGDNTRPLLQCEDPLAKITELLESRREAYEACADVIVDVDGRSVDEILENIGRELERLENRTDKTKLLVINGPNINFLGIRERNVYGTQDYAFLLDMIKKKAAETGCEIEVFQSNHEGAIIDRIQEAYFDGTEGIVINPGAYTHYSYAIRDALASITVPKVEIHISDITKREDFRKVSVTAPVCDRQIFGQGLQGYLQAIDHILNS